MERLQKLLARAGIASRRAAERLILEGRVTVDGHVVRELGTRADPTLSVIAVDGQPLRFPAQDCAFMVHKPAGFVTARVDDRGRPTVMSLIPRHLRRLVYPVGRLDLQSTGLVLLLNDGTLAFRIMHPSHHIPKTYLVQVAAAVSEEHLRALREGMELEDGRTAPAEVNVVAGDRSCLRMVLYEGRKRQIRRMLRSLGHEVIRLHRIAIGPVELGDLPEGQARALLPAELAALRRSVGLES